MMLRALTVLVAVGLAAVVNGAQVWYTYAGGTAIPGNEIVLLAGESVGLELHVAVEGPEQLGGIDFAMIELDNSGLTVTNHWINPAANWDFFAFFPPAAGPEDRIACGVFLEEVPSSVDLMASFTLTTAADGDAVLGLVPMIGATGVVNPLGTDLPTTVTQLAITPEPTSLAFLILGGLALRRWRPNG